MKVKILGGQGYNYMGKDGLQKTGVSLNVCTVDPVFEDDGNGNFTIGDCTENVPLRGYKISRDELEQLIQCVVQLQYERLPGKKQERLTGIELLENDCTKSVSIA